MKVITNFKFQQIPDRWVDLLQDGANLLSLFYKLCGEDLLQT
jgi:hypothetical protein